MSKKKSLPEQIKEVSESPSQIYDDAPVDWGKPTISTGSLLLDLAISGLKTRYGGLPAGKFVEIFGDSGLGKTTIAGEIAGAGQRAGGEVIFDDPEHRLEPDYCRMMGVKYDPSKFNYPESVTDLEESIIGPIVTKSGKEERDLNKAWIPDIILDEKGKEIGRHSNINVRCVDSLSALCSRMEAAQGDKRGQKRAKDFHQMFRLIKGHILRHNILLVATNQIIDKIQEGGPGFGPKTTTSGGHAHKFYASIRIELKPRGAVKFGDVIIGKRVEAFIAKSSIDIEWRTAPIFLTFGYGIDDIRANLVWLKEKGAMNEHPTDPAKKAGYVIGDKNFISLEAAIKHIEDNDLEQDIRDWVVDVWNEIEKNARPPRKEKVR